MTGENEVFDQCILTQPPDVGSIPTAPTIHLPDGWTLIQIARGQKGADKANDPVRE